MGRGDGEVGREPRGEASGELPVELAWWCSGGLGVSVGESIVIVDEEKRVLEIVPLSSFSQRNRTDQE